MSMCRVECDSYAEDCGCECICHKRCLVRMPMYDVPCWCRPGHRHAHRTRQTVEGRRARERIRNEQRRRRVA